MRRAYGAAADDLTLRRQVLRPPARRPLLTQYFRGVRSPPAARCPVRPFTSAPPGFGGAVTRDAIVEGQTRIVLSFDIDTGQPRLAGFGILS